jgi:diguanylate cyclase (GGDEF)-like protein
MITLISTDLLAIIALLFLMNLAKRNIVINNEKNKVYIYAVVTTIILLLLEIGTIYIEYSGNSNLMMPFRIINVLGFSLSPLVPFFLLLLFGDENNKLHTFFLTLPLYLNAVICILSFNTGLVFLVDAQSQYTRGNLFLLPTIVSMFYYVLFLIDVTKNSTEYKLGDKKVIISIFFLPVIGIIIQMLFKDLLLIWSCTSISLLLFYIFLLEIQFRYDVQTKIKNRASFEDEMQQYTNGNNNATIVIFDINDLKITNDRYGHKYGDELIFEAASIIKESFIDIGIPYRIGGDEFCVICKEGSKKMVDEALTKFDDLLMDLNENREIKLTLAYGHAFYNKNGIKSIYSIFSEADKAMYTNKTKSKGLYGRREQDQ